MSEHGMCVVVSGTLDTGFTLIGPFSHPAYAADWAQTWEEDITWEILPLVHPSTRETPQEN